jgi:hypothetical protein
LKDTVDELKEARGSIATAKSDLESARSELEVAEVRAKELKDKLAALEKQAVNLIAAIKGRKSEADALFISFQASLTVSQQQNLEIVRKRNPEKFRQVSDGRPSLNRLWPNGKTLKIRFLNGDVAVQREIEEVAQEWSRYANLKFQFGADRDAEIRIAIGSPGEGTWSYVGNQALAISGEKPTMTLGLQGVSISEDHFRFAVLHEFGHVLGLIHEQGNPNASIAWDKEAIYQKFSYWTPETVERNITGTDKSIPAAEYRAFDPLSIMWYPVPMDIIPRNLVVREAAVLSESDKKFVSQLYPSN